MKKLIGLIVIGFAVYFTWETWKKVEPLIEKYQAEITTFPTFTVMIIFGYMIVILATYIIGLKLLFSRK